MWGIEINNVHMTESHTCYEIIRQNYLYKGREAARGRDWGQGHIVGLLNKNTLQYIHEDIKMKYIPYYTIQKSNNQIVLT